MKTIEFLATASEAVFGDHASANPAEVLHSRIARRSWAVSFYASGLRAKAVGPILLAKSQKKST